MQRFISPEYRAKLLHKFQTSPRQGLIKMLVLIVIAIIIISVLGFDIRAAIENPQTQANFSYLGEMISGIWNTYLEDIWFEVHRVIGPAVDFLWNNFKNFDFNSVDTSKLQNFEIEMPNSN